MRSSGTKLLSRIMTLFFLAISLIPAAPRTAAQAPNAEQTLWGLEHDYFRYVEANNLSAYSSLWHKGFLGWPSVSPTPVHKEHITDWITSETSQGLSFKLVHFEPAAIQVTGDIGVTCYWATYKFIDKEGNGEQRVTRITHTWLKEGKTWHIIGGMSMPESAQAAARPEVPEKLSAPAAEHLILQLHATGSQTYVCQAGADQKLSWVFKAPEARLFDSSGQPVGEHYAGPTWKYNDGSAVVGKIAARQDAPDSSDIPWLLLTAADHAGSGVFARITSIQRLHTKGGQPPATGCDEAHRAAEIKSVYSADYYFYSSNN